MAFIKKIKEIISNFKSHKSRKELLFELELKEETIDSLTETINSLLHKNSNLLQEVENLNANKKFLIGIIDNIKLNNEKKEPDLLSMTNFKHTFEAEASVDTAFLLLTDAAAEELERRVLKDLDFQLSQKILEHLSERGEVYYFQDADPMSQTKKFRKRVTIYLPPKKKAED